MVFSSCCYEENTTTVSRATTKRLAFSCSSCYNYKPIPFRAIEHVILSVNHLQSSILFFSHSWLTLIFSLCLFLAHACVQVGAFRWKFFWFYLLFAYSFVIDLLSPHFTSTISPFQKYPTQTQSSVHYRPPQSAPLTLVCLSCIVTLCISLRFINPVEWKKKQQRNSF